MPAAREQFCVRGNPYCAAVRPRSLEGTLVLALYGATFSKYCISPPIRCIFPPAKAPKIDLHLNADT
jgi:hypothetical protein